jgi:HSP20 family protein
MAAEQQSPEGLLTSSVERLRHELDRWLDAAWSQGEKAIDSLGLRSLERDWCPAVDVYETQDAVRVDLELPGVDTAAVDVTLSGNMLTVSAPIDPGPGDVVVRRRERPRGRFRRSIPLPVAVNPDQVQAASRNGLLTVTIGKAESAKEKRVPVQGPSPMA